MKLVLYDDSTQPSRHRYLRGILKDDAVIDIEHAVGHLAAGSPQRLMVAVIDNFDSLRPELERLAESGPSLPLSGVRLRPPLPRPSKILACIGNYWEHMQREPRPLNMFLKSPDAVIGPGDTVVLPDFQGIEVFHHEAELGIVIGDRDYWSNSYGYDAVITLLDYMFTEKKLKRVYLHTLEWNTRAQRCFEKSGFAPVKMVRRMLQDFILMQVLREDWLETSEERLAARWSQRDKDASSPSLDPAPHSDPG